MRTRTGGRQVKTEITVKRLLATLRDLYPQKSCFLRRKQGSFCVEWIPLARITIPDQDSYRMVRNTELRLTHRPLLTAWPSGTETYQSSSGGSKLTLRRRKKVPTAGLFPSSTSSRRLIYWIAAALAQADRFQARSKTARSTRWPLPRIWSCFRRSTARRQTFGRAAHR